MLLVMRECRALEPPSKEQGVFAASVRAGGGV